MWRTERHGTDCEDFRGRRVRCRYDLSRSVGDDSSRGSVVLHSTVSSMVDWVSASERDGIVHGIVQLLRLEGWLEAAKFEKRNEGAIE